ncbi:hypothetical protein HK100_011627 [Physocladia obscura]|uniref:Ubiquitin carboxyl-terminal hydrolase 14 n=1 Tax=Physocladia obscura TaxID=109957 RepID=A0AAD5XGH5_9FUNG|nr:hypothetical protein HK100_011627 [Physocladia obscura]
MFVHSNHGFADVKIAAPLELDLGAFKSSGVQSNEILFPEETVVAPAEPIVDASAMEQLTGMGFSELRSKKALLKTGNNGAETAMNWLFEHMEDSDIDDPIEATSGSVAASDSVDYSSFVDMGFSISQAKKAMSQTNNNLERAIDWLFSHSGEEMAIDEPVVPTISGSETSASPRYELIGFISHRGTSAHCGHYVAHIKKGDQWVLFNDNKVAEVPDAEKAIGEAYIYFYKSIL